MFPDLVKECVVSSVPSVSIFLPYVMESDSVCAKLSVLVFVFVLARLSVLVELPEPVVSLSST